MDLVLRALLFADVSGVPQTKVSNSGRFSAVSARGGKAYEQIRRDENLAKAYKEYNLMAACPVILTLGVKVNRVIFNFDGKVIGSAGAPIYFGGYPVWLAVFHVKLKPIWRTPKGVRVPC